MLLHDGSEYALGCRGRAEVEAESDIIGHTAGLTTAPYSFGYVAGWAGGDPNVIKATAERVTAAARDILNQAGLLDPAQQRQAA